VVNENAGRSIENNTMQEPCSWDIGDRIDKVAPWNTPNMPSPDGKDAV
jgi:hypothetical protein